MTEYYRPSMPENAPPAPWTLRELHDRGEGLVVVLKTADGVNVQLVFKDFVAYRNINESFKLRTWRKKAPTPSVCCFRVENSEWLKWLKEESDGILDDWSLDHYAVHTGDDCLDIAIQEDPEVTIASSQP